MGLDGEELLEGRGPAGVVERIRDRAIAPSDQVVHRQVPFVCAPVRIGDVLTVTERLTDIAEKNGSSGPLVFVTTEAEYHNQARELVGRYRQTVIFL